MGRPKQHQLFLKAPQQTPRFTRPSRREKRTSLASLTQTHLESITDALQEIELLIDEDDGVPYRIGDSFYTLSSDEATERMEGEKGVVEAQVEGLEEQLETIREELNKLKAKLYGKFGTSINLEK